MKQKIKKSFDIYDAGLYLRLSRDDADEDGTKTKSKLRNCKGFVQIWKRVY